MFNTYPQHEVPNTNRNVDRSLLRRKVSTLKTIRRLMSRTPATPTQPATLPSLVIPAGPGARVGIQVDGKFRADRDLLRVGLTLQQILSK